MNLSEACNVLQTSRSGYHAHLRKHTRARRCQDAVLATALREEFAASRQTYGAPRLVISLRERRMHHGKNRIRRLMRQQGLRVRQKRRFIPRTTVADKAAVPAPNLLKAHPAPAAPNQAWVTDITYIPTGEGWLYLAAEMDLCTRRILGWDAGPSLTTELTVRALNRALSTRRGCDLRRLLHHSDRGCQYTSHTFRRQLTARGITQSMSRAGNCYDNVAMESFWATLKAECLAHCTPATRAQARAMILDYIETFYNPVRKHSSLGYLSPVNFEQSLLNN